jgi:PmbA protein
MNFKYLTSKPESLKEFIDSQHLLDIMEYCDTILQNKSEIKAYELIGQILDGTSIEIENEDIKDAVNSVEIEVGLRIIGELGNSSSVAFFPTSRSEAKKELERCLSILKYATPDPYFISLAKPQSLKHHVYQHFDDKISRLDIDDMKKYAEIILSAMDVPNYYSLNGSLANSKGFASLINSNGIAVAESSTRISGGISINLEKDGSVGSGFQSESQQSIEHFSLQKAVDEAHLMASRMLNKTKIPSGEYELVFSPKMVNKLIARTIAAGANFQGVFQNRSFLCGKEKKSIARDKLTIFNDPEIPFAEQSSPIDDEGVPTYKFAIVQNGILETYLYNTYWANRVNKESNGCASRSGPAAPSMINSKNLVIRPGDASEQEILSTIKNGIYCEYTGDSPNIASGQFSGVIMTGYKIENGEITTGVEEAVLGINLIDLYNKIELIGNNITKVGSNYVPSIKLGKIIIGGN